MTLNEIRDMVHSLAREKGFWDAPRNFGEMIALIKSEFFEALEADRKDAMDDHCPGFKGRDIELADAVIRILDVAGGRGYDMEGWNVTRFKTLKQIGEYTLSGFRNEKNFYDDDAIEDWNNFAEWMNYLSNILSDINYRSTVHEATRKLGSAICVTSACAYYFDIDIEAALMAKHEYNKTRPPRHGKRY